MKTLAQLLTLLGVVGVAIIVGTIYSSSILAEAGIEREIDWWMSPVLIVSALATIIGLVLWTKEEFK